MAMLAAPDTITGPLTAADLDRDTNRGRIWPQPLTGDELHAMFCAIEGGRHAEPKPAPTPRQSPLIAARLRLVRWLG